MVDKNYDLLIGLDRDGTLVHDPGYLGRSKNWKDQVQILPGTVEGLKAMRQARTRMVVCSNQAGVARGFFNTGVVEESNHYLNTLLREQDVWVDEWLYCPFIDEDYARLKKVPVDSVWVSGTDMRKPGTGMLKRAASRVDMSLGDFSRIYFIGDKFTDVQTAVNAGGSGIFIDNNDNKHSQTEAEKVKDAMKLPFYEGRVFIAKDLEEAAEIINLTKRLQARAVS